MLVGSITNRCYFSRAGAVHDDFDDQLILPMTVEDLHNEYVVVETKERPTFRFDFLFNTQGDDPREKPFRVDPFILEPGAPSSTTAEPNSTSLAQALIKVKFSEPQLFFAKIDHRHQMTLSTPAERFNENDAEDLLRHTDSDALQTAYDGLRSIGAVAWTSGDPSKPKPGPAYRYSDKSVHSLGCPSEHKLICKFTP